MNERDTSPIGFFQKYLTVWVILCMAVGICIGKFLPQIPEFLNRFEYARVSIPMAILIWVMIYAVRLIKALYGIDMEQTQYSKLISDIPEPDIAISMGCNVGCPFIGRPFDDNWELEDPTGKSDEEFKKVIDEIRVRIMELKQRLGKNIEA